MSHYILEEKPKKSCQQLKLENPNLESGYYSINVSNEQISVYCDMVTDGGTILLLIC